MALLKTIGTIATIGPVTYKTLRNVVMPRKPGEMSYQD